MISIVLKLIGYLLVTVLFFSLLLSPNARVQHWESISGSMDRHWESVTFNRGILVRDIKRDKFTQLRCLAGT